MEIAGPFCAPFPGTHLSGRAGEEKKTKIRQECFFSTSQKPVLMHLFLLENLRCFSPKNIGHSTDNPEAMTRLQPLQQELSQLGFLCRERSSLELMAFLVTERITKNGGSPGMTR